MKLLSIAGFDIKIDASWLLIAALMIWTLYSQLFPAELSGQSDFTYLAMAILGALAFFASLVLHELAHSVVARRYGLKIAGITLFVFGGVAELTQEPKSARAEFWIAIAGPVMSFALSALFALAAGAGEAASQGAVATVLSYLSQVNLGLAVFNLIPAFPLDGGRIFRSILWSATGSMDRATRVAAGAGTLFAWVLIGLGAVELVAYRDAYGLWAIMIGMFLMTAAQSARTETVLRADLGGRKVLNAMTRDPVTVHPESTVASVADDLMLGRGLSLLPVVRDGRLLGQIDARLIRALPRDRWSALTVAEVLQPLGAQDVLSPGLGAYEALRWMASTGRRKAVVVDDGRVVGILTLADLMDYVGLAETLASAARS